MCILLIGQKLEHLKYNSRLENSKVYNWGGGDFIYFEFSDSLGAKFSLFYMGKKFSLHTNR